MDKASYFSFIMNVIVVKIFIEKVIKYIRYASQRNHKTFFQLPNPNYPCFKSNLK